VEERTGVSAWLTLSRRGEDYDPGVSRMLEALAPLLRGALRSYIALEHERFRSSIADRAMQSLHFAWLTLDAAGTIIDCDAEANVVLARSGVLTRRPDGRLAAQPAGLNRELHDAIRRLAADPEASPRAMTLSQDPWLDMLLVPARRTRLTAEPPAIVAYIHGDSWRSSDRCGQISELFGLSPSEARLALALSRGRNLEEAAAELGFSLETVRTYSKRIYAKTGARGLPDLVRILMRSILAFAPDKPMPS
jgi:DNA-binding CsgD family transcriptional regulator